MRQHRQHDVERFRYRFRASGEIDHERAIPHSRERARKHRGLHMGYRCGANRLGDSRNLVIQNGGRRLWRPVARRKPRASAGNHEICRPRVGELDQLRLQRGGVVRKKLSRTIE